MDACVWLLQQGADPDQIRWIVPRDSWVLRRGNFQPGAEHFARFCRSLADQVTAVVECDGIDDLFRRLEATDELARVDPTVTPGAYHCAILSDGELAELRRITDVVRLGRVRSIDRDQLELEQGTITARADSCYVDCSAAGIPSRPSKPIFEGDRITLQWVRTCQPTFSAAFIGHVEATFGNDDEKNRVCRPIEPPTVPLDWLRMLAVQLDNRRALDSYPQLQAWLTGDAARPLLEDGERAHRSRRGSHRAVPALPGQRGACEGQARRAPDSAGWMSARCMPPRSASSTTGTCACGSRSPVMGRRSCACTVGRSWPSRGATRWRTSPQRGWRVAALDVRGYGGSSSPPEVERYTRRELAGDVAAVAAALDDDPVVLFGHDWGAPIASHAAIRHPDRVRAVANLSVPHLAAPLR